MTTKPSSADNDLDEIIRLVSAESKDPQALHEARERGEFLRESIRSKYGVRNIAVDLLTEARDSE